MSVRSSFAVMGDTEWLVKDFLAPRVRLHHPSHNQAGDLATVDIDETHGRRRIHVWTPDRSEVYFELVVYPHLIDGTAAAAGQRSYLEAEDATKWDVDVTIPREAELLGRAATTMQVWFSDQDGRFLREFYFVGFPEAATPWSLRVVFDPRSAVNQAILERLELKS